MLCFCKASTIAESFTGRKIVSASLSSHLQKYPGSVRDAGERLHTVVYIRRQVAGDEDAEQRGMGSRAQGSMLGGRNIYFLNFPSAATLSTRSELLQWI